MSGYKFSEKRLNKFHSGSEFKAYEIFGSHYCGGGKYLFRVWAPHAQKVCLEIISSGKKYDFRMHLLSDGESFEIEAEAKQGDKYRYIISTFDGREIVKSDPYAFQSDFPHSDYSVICDLQFASENKQKEIPHNKRTPVNIYEVNLLSWKRKENNGYYSFKDLQRELVPYVKEMGYTHVEFMPVTEYPFDGSWGYQVTGYFSVIARLGAPEDFKNLIDCLHENGIKVILDWVPAHFPKDDWGLYEFDGQPLYECPLWDKMEFRSWGTRRFDFGRGEIDSFLISSAYFFFDVYKIDGLRVDAVASMIYLDYEKSGDFIPNIYGDNRNLEGIEFIKKFNSAVKNAFPGVITIAEESSAFPGVTKSVEDGGLGFDYKWNMGWMNDVLFYCKQDPYFRSYHHNKLTFSLLYAFSENFILPLSHDEVVHVKGSIINKMFGEYEDKFAGERTLLAFMFAHPGKKLNFMGYEVAQFKEWDYNSGIEFFLADKFEFHNKMQLFVKTLNNIYRNETALYERDDGWDGFQWLVVDDNYNNVLAFSRKSSDGEIITVINFSGVDICGYNIDFDYKGKFSLLLDTDDKIYGGKGKNKKKIFNCKKQTGTDKKYSLNLDIPTLTCMYLKKEK